MKVIKFIKILIQQPLSKTKEMNKPALNDSGDWFVFYMSIPQRLKRS